MLKIFFELRSLSLDYYIKRTVMFFDEYISSASLNKLRNLVLSVGRDLLVFMLTYI